MKKQKRTEKLLLECSKVIEDAHFCVEYADDEGPERFIKESAKECFDNGILLEIAVIVYRIRYPPLDKRKIKDLVYSGYVQAAKEFES